MKQSRILIIDDSPIFRLMTSRTLADEGYEVFEVSSGPEGLEFIQKSAVDLIVTDVLMPVMDGYEFVRRLRLDPAGKNIKVIFYTGTFSGLEESELAKIGGVLSIIAKPAEPSEMKRIVAEALALKNLDQTILDSHFDQEHLRILTNQLSDKVMALERANQHLRQEVNKRTQAEMEAKESQVFFQAVADTIPQLAWRARADGYIEYTNRRWREFHGFSEDSFQLEKWTLFIHPGDQARALLQMKEAFSRNQNFQFEARLLRASDRSFIPHWISAISVVNPADLKSTWFCTCTDISVQKKYEEQLVHLKEQAESLSRAKTEFLNNISHEIRTPLTAILGFSEVLVDDLPELKNNRYMARIQNGAQHLTSILNDLIAISEIEANGIVASSELFSTSQIIKNISSSFQQRIRSKSLNFVTETNLLDTQQLISYPDVLTRILSYLMDNAIKFTENGSIVLRSSIEDRNKDLTLIFEIEDTGVGISSENQKILFNLFQQGDGSSTRKHGGLGLGLLLSKKLAETIGSRLELVSSAPGIGSRFRLSTPIQRPVEQI